MNGLRDEILKLLYQFDIPQREVAAALGMSDQTFHYQLNHAKKLDENFEANVKRYLNKRNIVLMDECGKLSNLTLEFTALIGHEVSILASTVAKDISDGRISHLEKEQLKKKIGDMRHNINAEIDKLEELANG